MPKDDLDEAIEDQPPRKKTRWSGGENYNETKCSTISILMQRHPHSITASVWGDGTQGPLIAIFGEGKARLSAKAIKKINTEYEGELIVMTSGKDNE